MVVHEAVAVAAPIVPFNQIIENGEELRPVLIIEKDRRTRVSPSGQMIHCSWIFYS